MPFQLDIYGGEHDVTLPAVDLFAGPGGWDLGARELGLDPLGIELDPDPCAVRRAYGLPTVQGDVSAIDPLDYNGAQVLIASPPCTAFSMAGKGEGRKAIGAYLDAIDLMRSGTDPNLEVLDDACGDPTAHLVLEPLRWALQIPSLHTVVLEQVPPVLPVWQAMARALRDVKGWHAWTGILSSEQYGVPQTRQRAVLIASANIAVHRPKPTHQRYIAPRSRDDEGGGLFDLPDPEHIVAAEDRHLPRWVSMAQALGWSTADRIGFPRRADDGLATDDGYRERDFRTADQPAFNLTEKARSWSRLPSELRAGAQEKSTRRSANEPAPTITGGNDYGERVWVGGHPVAMNTGRDWKKGGTREDAQTIPVDQPAPTMSAKLPTQAHWVYDRPATTIAGDPRVFSPGGHMANDGRDNSRMVGRSDEAIRVTEEEAACLQSFPPGYPWHAAGTRSAAFRCIGNAVPPLLAKAILEEALGL